MFWILRRTGAVNFFNSINNNYSSKSTSSNNNNLDKLNQKPPRKGYGRLCMDIDENVSNKQNIPLNDFNILDGKIQANNNNINNINNINNNNNNNNINNNNDSEENTSILDEQIDNISKPICRRIPEYCINRLDAMDLSEDDEYDESLTCNVCDRAFHCHRQLASHQQKKRHFGCNGCDSLFPTLMLLEHHKEEFEHWSDTEFDSNHLSSAYCKKNRIVDFSDTDSVASDAESEDLERLL